MPTTKKATKRASAATVRALKRQQSYRRAKALANNHTLKQLEKLERSLSRLRETATEHHESWRDEDLDTVAPYQMLDKTRRKELLAKLSAVSNAFDDLECFLMDCEIEVNEAADMKHFSKPKRPTAKKAARPKYVPPVKGAITYTDEEVKAIHRAARIVWHEVEPELPPDMSTDDVIEVVADANRIEQVLLGRSHVGGKATPELADKWSKTHYDDVKEILRKCFGNDRY